MPFLYHNALTTVVGPMFWRQLPKDIQNIILTEVCPEVEKRANNRILELESSMIKFAEQSIGQKEILVPPEVFFPMLDWAVKNIWEKRVQDYPAGLPLWEEGARVAGYTLKNGKFSWSEGSLGEILCGNLWWQTQEVSRDWPTDKNRTGGMERG